MSAQYSSVNSMSQRKVYEWVAKFKSGRKRVSDEAWLGHLSTSCTEDHIDHVNAFIQEDQRNTVSEVAELLDISAGSAYAVLHDNLGCQKVCARWVPRQLTNTHKQQHMEVATQYLQLHEEDPGLLDGIFIGDET